MPFSLSSAHQFLHRNLLLHLPSFLRRQLASIGRIRAHQIFLHRLGKRCITASVLKKSRHISSESTACMSVSICDFSRTFFSLYSFFGIVAPFVGLHGTKPSRTAPSIASCRSIISIITKTFLNHYKEHETRTNYKIRTSQSHHART